MDAKLKKNKAKEEIILLFSLLSLIMLGLFFMFYPIFKSSRMNLLKDALFIALMSFVIFWISRIIIAAVKALKK
jgi:hypothetical protein